MVTEQNIAVLVLAAGQSTRLGQAKQLVTFKEQSLIVRQVELALTISPNVYCVLGCYHQKIKAEVATLPIACIYHQNWQQGLGSSIAKGVQSLPENVDAVLLLLVDQWQLNSQDLQHLFMVWQQNPNNIIISASPSLNNGANTLSPPVIFPKAFFHELTLLSGEEGAKPVLKKHRHQLSLVTMAHAFYDLDTPEQLAKLNQIQDAIETKK